MRRVKLLLRWRKGAHSSITRNGYTTHSRQGLYVVPPRGTGATDRSPDATLLTAGVPSPTVTQSGCLGPCVIAMPCSRSGRNQRLGTRCRSNPRAAWAAAAVLFVSPATGFQATPPPARWTTSHGGSVREAAVVQQQCASRVLRGARCARDRWALRRCRCGERNMCTCIVAYPAHTCSGSSCCVQRGANWLAGSYHGGARIVV